MKKVLTLKDIFPLLSQIAEVGLYCQFQIPGLKGNSEATFQKYHL